MTTSAWSQLPPQYQQQQPVTTQPIPPPQYQQQQPVTTQPIPPPPAYLNHPDMSAPGQSMYHDPNRGLGHANPAPSYVPSDIYGPPSSAPTQSNMSLNNGQYQAPSPAARGGTNVTVPVQVIGAPAVQPAKVVVEEDNACGYGFLGFVLGLVFGIFAYLFLLCMNMTGRTKNAFIIGTSVAVAINIIAFIAIAVAVSNSGNSYY